ncbi:LWR-salt protein [Halocatena halophila]|uniref:LWR-salt protein n=1 Tax=Halocatena halophila TaxID=2814576 RepID=UPI002ED0C960
MSRPPAEYVVRVTFRLEPNTGRIDPQRFQTTVAWPAPTPGEEGWLWFRNHLWRGELTATGPVRERAARTLDVAHIEQISFSELQTTESYLDALYEKIETRLDDPDRPFKSATSIEAVIRNYFGSSIRVRS